jgi:hypothetical protein
MTKVTLRAADARTGIDRASTCTDPEVDPMELMAEPSCPLALQGGAD